MIARDPTLEVDKRPAGERTLLRKRFLRAAQTAAALALERVRERWEQAEIDVHRLVRARAGEPCLRGSPIAADST